MELLLRTLSVTKLSRLLQKLPHDRLLPASTTCRSTLATTYRYTSTKMRELITDKFSENSEKIYRNVSGKNDFLNNILDTVPPSRISIELSPNIPFNGKVLAEIQPRFVSVTWLGNTHLELTNAEIPAIVLAKKFCDYDYPVLLHLAGRNISAKRMMDILEYLKRIGIKNILALQGDWLHVLEQEDTKCDFPYASDLVKFIKTHFSSDFCIGVAAYPHLHPHSKSQQEDLEFLKLKVSLGADFIITQADFDYNSLNKFAILCKENGINVPILAGIFVIRSFKALESVVKYCEFKVSETVWDFVENHKNDDAIVEKFGTDLARDLIKKCSTNKDLFAGVQVFSMNKIEVVQKVILG